jgi:outer membrane protein OmpA-like peptidoglycan-associated protein
VVLAQAPPPARVDAQLFRPAFDPHGFVTVSSSEMLARWAPSFGLYTSYGRDPVVLPGGFRVENQVAAHLQVALGLFKVRQWALSLGVGLPLGLWRGQSGASGIDAQGIGDLGLHPKLRLLDTLRFPVGVALLASVYLPTASYPFAGEQGATFAPTLILDTTKIHPRLRFGINLGARLHGEGRFTAPGGGGDGVVIPSRSVTWGSALAVNLVRGRLDAVAEAYGTVGLGGGRRDAPAEATGSLRVYLERSSYFTFGAGAGLHRDPGAPAVRAFVGFVFQPTVGDRDGDGIPDDEDDCPDEPGPVETRGCPRDTDGDGLIDSEDACPLQPGPRENHGCPFENDEDRDGDGIPDRLDKCPDEPEDFDGYQDDDGCPDPDNDMDGIPDKEDLCPDQAEDFDGYEDEDGCPDIDNDKDGIPDHLDMCPNEPETFNGLEDDDGCPDRNKGIKVTSTHIWLEKIYFETGKAVIRPISFATLDALVATLKAASYIQRVQVEGHADERGSDAYNDDLTLRRAVAVRRYLIDHGIDGDRLVAKGFGKRRPIDRRHTPAAWEKNRRVDFVILQRSDRPR